MDTLKSNGLKWRLEEYLYWNLITLFRTQNILS